jgi:hypothetical protein
MQSRRISLVKSAANVVVGYAISVGATKMILPAFGYAVSTHDAFGIGAIFTFISLVRSFALRRIFNRI